MPFLAGRNFILHQSAKSLAEVLEVLACEETITKNLRNINLPWPLSAILFAAQSPSDLAFQAQRLRRGELGDTDDWLAAENRWRKHGFVPADWEVFSDADWPFTSMIGLRGITAMPSMSIADYENSAPTIKELTKIFTTTTSLRVRSEVGTRILSFAGIIHGFFRNTNLPEVSISDLFALVQATTGRVLPHLIIGSIEAEPDLDFVTEVDVLDAIGNRVELQGFPFQSYIAEERKVAWNKIANQLITLLGGKHPREGILRLLTSLAAMRVPLPEFSINTANLSTQGHVLNSILNLFNQKYTSLSSEALAQQIAALWSVLDPESGDSILKNVFTSICNGRRLITNDILQVMDRLAGHPSVDVESRLTLMEELIAQTRFRTSGLGSARRQKALGI